MSTKSTDPTKLMSPKDFAAAMKKLAETDDIEERHGKMDDLMCEVLRSLGYSAGVKVFDSTGKWYA